MSGKTHLYRHFDSKGELLYIGVSYHAMYRMSQHKDSAKWFDEISVIKVEQYPTRKMAELAEKRAIKKENPKYNKKYSKCKKEDFFYQDRNGLVEIRFFLPNDLFLLFKADAKSHDRTYIEHVNIILEERYQQKGPSND